MMQCEADLEQVKQNLCLKTDFNLHDAYGVFDPSVTGYINRR